MKRREQGRQIALQALYVLDLRREPFGPEIVEFIRESTADPEVYFFARKLVQEAWDWRGEADRLIEQAAEHWRVDRMATIDRNILRLAAYEMSECPDVPDRVALDQAIELAKRFGAAESGGFVNGVLDHVLRLLVRRREARGEVKAERPPAAGGEE